MDNADCIWWRKDAPAADVGDMMQQMKRERQSQTERKSFVQARNMLIAVTQNMVKQ